MFLKGDAKKVDISLERGGVDQYWKRSRKELESQDRAWIFRTEEP